MIDLDRLKAALKEQEGIRRSAYSDSLGYITIGVGRMIDARKGGGLSMEEIEFLLDNDIDKAFADTSSKIHFFNKLSSIQQEALMNMCFQMGIVKLLGFKKMLAALEAKDYQKVREEGMSSNWYNQTPKRALAVIDMLCGG